MIKTLLTSAAAIALVSTAALADPAAPTTAAAEATPQYQMAPEASDAAAISPIDVTTKDDAQKLADTEFLAADANADGVVDETEFAARAADAAMADPLAVAKDAAPADKAFAAIAKGDKKISKQELVDAREKNFDEADANRDKMLDALEQQKFAALVAVKPVTSPRSQ
jgi:hypothetical protein